MAMDQWQLQQLITQAESAGQALAYSLDKLQATVGLSLFRELWAMAGPEERQEVVTAYLAGIKKDIEKHAGFGAGDVVRQTLEESGLLRTPESLEALRKAVIERAVLIVMDSRPGYYDESSKGVYPAIVAATHTIVGEIAAEVCRMKREQIAEAVMKHLADNVIDDAVKAHADSLIRRLKPA